MREYGVVTFGGHGFDKPLGTVTGMRSSPSHVAARGVVGGAPPPATISFTTKIEGSDTSFFDDLAALLPEPAPAVMAMSMPCGILGNVSVSAHVTGSDPMRETAEGSTLTMRAEMDPRAWRRAVSMAVERAITTTNGREDVALRVRRQDGPVMARMADKILGMWAGDRGCYRGERKARKAMRRLLRAAGVTRPQ